MAFDRSRALWAFIEFCAFAVSCFKRKIKPKINFGRIEHSFYICSPILSGALAQLVEQRTENPCVPGSIPGGTTF